MKHGSRQPSLGGGVRANRVLNMRKGKMNVAGFIDAGAAGDIACGRFGSVHFYKPQQIQKCPLSKDA